MVFIKNCTSNKDQPRETATLGIEPPNEQLQGGGHSGIREEAKAEVLMI